MLRLKQMLHEKEIRQAVLANHLRTSEGLVSQLLNHEHWPRRIKREDLEPRIRDFMTTHAFTDGEQARAFEPLSAAEHQEMLMASLGHKVNAPAGDSQQGQVSKPKNKSAEPIPEDEVMLLRKQSLSPAAKKAFGLFRDPFGEIATSEEVFVSPDIRYVREAMWHACRFGGMYSVVGESGSGKSTVRRDLYERIERENAQVKIIEPYIVGMEDNDMKGKTLRASHIVEAIMAEIAPLATVKRSPEARYRQVHDALRESSRAGWTHVIVIEEAHSIPIPTLKHLKRFYELEDGFKKLLGIVLIGQTELAQKLDERNPIVREVVQRCELITLNPLNEHLKPYIHCRLKNAGIEPTQILDDEAIEALRAKLTPGRNRPGQPGYSVLYPLAVGNVLVAAMNAAAEFGVPRVTADLIQGV